MAVVTVDAPRVNARLDGWRYPLAIGVLSRLYTFIVLGVIGYTQRQPGQGLGTALLEPFGAWDGIWYRRIADFGYDPTVAHGNSVAFSPLFPLLDRVVHNWLSVGYIAAGIIISTTFFLIAMVLLYGLIERRSGQRIARTAVWLTAFFPMAYLFSSVYTESTYLLLTVATFVVLERGLLLAASGVGALAVMTRPTGIMLAPAMLLRIWKDGGRRVDWAFAWRALPVLLLPFVYVAFGAYLYLRTGDPFATQTAQATGWGRGINLMLVLALPIAAFDGLIIAARDYTRGFYLFDTAMAMTWCLLLIEGALRRRLPTEYLLYAALAVILPVFAGTYLALPRYGMGIFVVMWLAAIHVTSRPRLALALKVLLPISMIVIASVSIGTGLYVP